MDGAGYPHQVREVPFAFQWGVAGARRGDTKYVKFRLPSSGVLREPDVEIPLDEYRSYHRDKRSPLETRK